MRHPSTLIKFLIRLLFAALLVFGIVFYLGGTESGLQLVWSRARIFLPDELRIGSVHGALLSHVTAENITYKNQQIILTIKSIDLRWDALKLLRKHFVIHDLAIDQLLVTDNPQIASAASVSSSPSISSQQILTCLRYLRLEKMDVHQAKVRLGNTNVDINGGMDKRWHLQWSARIPALQYYLNDLHGEVLTSGTVQGERGKPEIAADIAVKRFVSKYFSIGLLTGSLHSAMGTASEDVGKCRVNDLRIMDYHVPDFALLMQGRYPKHGYQVDVQAILSPVNRIKARFDLPKLGSLMDINQPFHASASVDVKDFSQFNILFKDVPQVRQVTGRVTGSFTGDGTILHPVFDGGLQAHDASVFVPAANRLMSSVSINTHYHTGEAVTMDGTFVAGDGDAGFSGTFGIEEPALPLRLQFHGTHVTAINTKEYKVKMSPDMQLYYHDNDLLLTGRIDIPFAEIAPVDFRATETLPSDVIVVNSKSPHTSVPTNVTMELRVVLGDQVKVKYHELQSQLHGAVTISGMEGKPLTATGEFNIDSGTYRAYGRRLTISQGRLIYAGNFLTNPGISLRASQVVKTVGVVTGSQYSSQSFAPGYSGERSLVVGVFVSGTLDKPRITLFSDDAGLSQGDILSYLLFGYPQSQASGASGLALLNVASQITDNEDNANPVNKLQQKLGLDEFSVGTTEYFNTQSTTAQNATGNATTVNLGRHLGHQLSVHYSIGLFQQIQVFSLRYQINRHLAIQTETSTLENGGDLVYQLESAH